MAHFQGITVEIMSNGQVLKFYDDPDAAELEERHSRHHYIEAVAGSTFQVKVKLTPMFNFYEMKAGHVVRVEIQIASNLRFGVSLTKEELQAKFRRGKLGGYTFTYLKHYSEETGWLSSDLSFGSLVLSKKVVSLSIGSQFRSDNTLRRESRS